MKAFPLLLYGLVAALAAGTDPDQWEAQFPVCRCSGPETRLTCRTLLFATDAQARSAVKKTRPRGYAARGGCDSYATLFECCESFRTIRVAAPNVARRVKPASVALGRCAFQSRRRPVCQCTLPESSLTCATVVLPDPGQANDVVNKSNGTAALGECEARSTRFACCRTLNGTLPENIFVPATVVAARVKLDSVSLGPCNSTAAASAADGG
jgi:hypothetical protein